MREILNFDKNWLFHKEDENDALSPKGYGYAYLSAKTERMKSGPAAYRHYDRPDSWSFSDEVLPGRWKPVSLPHDFIISEEHDKNENPAHGYFKYYNAWYRKHFVLDSGDEGKRITLLFEGVTGNATVYLNGCLICRNFSSYTEFEADITDYVSFEEENVVAVYVDTTPIEGWWYGGGGIYRHVHLIKTSKLCVDLYGVYAYPLFEGGAFWKLPIITSVRNDTYDDEAVTLRHRVLSANGKCVAYAQICGTVGARRVCDLETEVGVESPLLWDIDSPNLYKVHTEVLKDNVAVDESETSIGFRTAVFDPDNGFFLNGRNLKIKGVCGHQSFGLTGVAVSKNIYEYSARLMKEMGANAYRCAHYPHSAAQMDVFDEMGILVLDEVRHFDSNKESLEQIESAVKRDRNRPSVIFWSTGNEELNYHAKKQGGSIQCAMEAQLRRFDRYRPVTSSFGFAEKVAIFDKMSFLGINYRLAVVDGLHEKYPDKPIVSTENCAITTSYGTYFGDRTAEGRKRANDYDRNAETCYFGREGTWKFIMKRKWLAGGFQWCFSDYLGEAAFPRLCSGSGAVDLFLQRKDAFYQNVSLWTDSPMVHVFPHWNLKGMEGRTVNVWAYTNCDALEFVLNGKKVGECKVEKYGHGECNIVYTPGKLEVFGYTGGKITAYDAVETTGRPAALVMRRENTPVYADGEDIALVTCCCVDEEGRLVPDAEPLVRFECDEPAVIVGTGSSECDPLPVTSHERRMFAGRITVGVRTGEIPGKIYVYAKSDTVAPAALCIEILEAANREHAVEGIIDDVINGGHIAPVRSKNHITD